jgi:hypothetical protein
MFLGFFSIKRSERLVYAKSFPLLREVRVINQRDGVLAAVGHASIVAINRRVGRRARWRLAAKTGACVLLLVYDENWVPLTGPTPHPK